METVYLGLTQIQAEQLVKLLLDENAKLVMLMESKEGMIQDCNKRITALEKQLAEAQAFEAQMSTVRADMAAELAELKGKA